MKLNTYTADKVDIAADMASYDGQAKMLISDPPILAYILSQTVPELKGMPRDEIIRRMGERSISTVPIEPGMTKSKLNELNTEQAEINTGRTFFDVLFTQVYLSGECIETYLYIDVEIQREESLGYDILPRAVFYCGRLLSMQYGMDVKKDDYGGLKKVYSIWLCLNCPMKDANTITRYHLTREDLYGVCSDHPYDYIEIVMVRLPEKDENIDENNELLRFVGNLLSDTVDTETKKEMLEGEYGIQMTREVEGRYTDMCNLSEGILERGIDIGIEQGKEQHLISLVQKKLNKGQSVEQIAEALEESPGTIQIIIEKLQ